MSRSILRSPALPAPDGAGVTVRGPRSREGGRGAARRMRLGGILACCAGLALAACSSTPGTGNSQAAGTSAGLPSATVKNEAIISGLKQDPSLAALVPASWRAKKTIDVATNASYPPDEFYASDNKTIVGWDPDLGHALAKLLGLKFTFVNTNFDEIIPGLAAHRYDMAMSSAGVEPEREKVIDFVTHFQAGLAFMVPAGSSAHPASMASLCGLTVAAEKGSVEEAAAQQQAKQCAKTHKQPLKLLSYPDQNAVNLALSSNRAQVGFADSPVVAYEVKISGGKFRQSGGVFQSGPEGIELPKDNAGMNKALQAAMNKLISTGAYQKILNNWGVANGAITTSQLRPAGSGS